MQVGPGLDSGSALEEFKLTSTEQKQAEVQGRISCLTRKFEGCLHNGRWPHAPEIVCSVRAIDVAIYRLQRTLTALLLVHTAIVW